MKKLILTAIVAVSTITLGYSQMSFGAKAGLNLASISGDGTDDVKSRTGLHIGFVAESMISDNFAVQAELLYSMQGAEGESSYEEFGITVNEELKAKYDYINLPILAKFYVAEGFSIHAGPQVGFLISAEEEYTASAEGESMSETEDVKEFMNTVDFGVVGGVGYKLDMGVFFNARYNVGISNLWEDADDFKQTNSVIQVGVGYMF